MRLRFALCNEVVRALDFARQCALAASLGYDGIELAPFTLSDTPQRLDTGRIAAARRTAEAAGTPISGLHWVLVRPFGLSLTDPDPMIRADTIEVMRRMCGLCAALGGQYIVHGGPRQRHVPADRPVARQWATDAFAAAAEAALAEGVVYCVEPLPAGETNFVNTIEDAVGLIETIGSPGLRTMLDTASASAGEDHSLVALVDRWLPTGMIAHVQVNDPNRRAPGQGRAAFAPVLRALARHQWPGWIGVEPFDYIPDGPSCAARAIGYLRGVEDAVGD